jgi:PAS domain-containing protein
VNSAFALKLAAIIVLGLLTVFVIDLLDPTTISTPFCLGIVLMGISLRQSTYLVVITSVIYTVLTTFALLRFQNYTVTHIHPIIHPHFWLFQRLGLFLVLCLLAIHVSHYRTGTDRILVRFRAILSKLPAPVIISDGSGNITYVNEAVAALLQQKPTDMTGKSYFDYFLTESAKGKSIRSYFELFEGNTSGFRKLEISPFGPRHQMDAQLSCLGTGPNRIMITVLHVGLPNPGAALKNPALPANFSSDSRAS